MYAQHEKKDRRLLICAVAAAELATLGRGVRSLLGLISRGRHNAAACIGGEPAEYPTEFVPVAIDFNKN